MWKTWWCNTCYSSVSFTNKEILNILVQQRQIIIAIRTLKRLEEIAFI